MEEVELMHVVLSFLGGLLIGILAAYLRFRSYKRMLNIVAREGGGYEKIKGKWYRISVVDEHHAEVIEDMGIPQRMRH